MKNILLASLCLLFISCSGSGKYSDARIDVSSILSLSSFSGGGMLYVKNKELNIQHSLSFNTQDVRLLLEYGTWEFVAFAWDGPDPMTGNLKCGKVVSSLTETSANIDLNISSSGCDTDFFAPATYRSGGLIKALSLINCSNISSVSAGGNCDGSGRGVLEFFKIRLIANGSSPLETVCLPSISPPASKSNTLSRIPIGGPEFSPSLEIEAYVDSNCTQSFRKYTYTQGLIGSSPNLNNSKIFPGSTSELFIESSGVYINGLSPFSASLGAEVDQTLTFYNFSGINITNLSSTLTAPFSFKDGAFPGTGGNCGTTLSQGSSCTLVITFSPVTTGSVTSTLSLNFDNPTAKTYSRPLLGSSPLAAFSKLTGISGAATTGRGIVVAGNGDTYVTGYTDGALDGETLNGAVDAFITKYDKDGVKLWTRLIGLTGATTTSYGIALDSSSNVYITGDTNGNLNGETLTGVKDLFISKFSSGGTLIWTRLLGESTKIIYPKDLTVDSSGNIYIAGHTNSNFDGNTLTGTSDSFIVKYDSSGTKLWTRLSGVATKTTRGVDVATDSAGNVYVAGLTNGALDGQTINGLGNHILLMKYSSSGTRLWVRLTGASGGSASGTAVAVDSNDNIYVGGESNIGLDGVPKMGGFDMVLLKYNSAGSKVFTKLLGVSGATTYTREIAVASNGFVYLGGITSGNLDGQSKTGTNDAFVTKFSHAGVKQWTKLMGSSSVAVEAYSLATDSGGYVLATGETTGNFDGESINGISDAFLTTEFNF